MEVGESIGERVGAEENPSEGDYEKGEGCGEEGRDSQTWNVLGLESFEGEQGSVNASPEEERPGCAVPEAAEEHGEKEVGVGSCIAEAVAAERDVEVLAQPR